MSAAINIMYLFHNYNVLGNDTPLAFRRGVLALPDPVPDPVPAAGGGGGAAVVVVGGDDILDQDSDLEDEI